MADAIKKTIRKIRHKFKRPEKIESPLEKLIAKYKAEEYKREFWERDKKVVRDKNFEKALVARAKQIEAIHAEQARQEEITKNRLKNLKKARRILAKQRNEE